MDVQKIKETAAFSALYADHVYLQDPFKMIYRKQSKFSWDEFLFAIATVNYLTPLINAGLISFIRELTICKNCLKST